MIRGIRRLTLTETCPTILPSGGFQEENMKPSKILFVLMIGLLVLPLAASKDKAVVSRWTAVPVQVDGNPAEWTADEITAEEDVGGKIAFRNDAENLYVLLILQDPKFQSTVERTGVKLWINPAMKTKKVHGIMFSKKIVTANELIQNLKDQGQAPTAEKEAELKTRPQYVLFGCDPMNKKGKILPHSGPTGTGAYRVSKGDHAMAYEFRIPLAMLNDPDDDLKVDPAKPFKVGAEWGGMTDQARAERMIDLHGTGGISESDTGIGEGEVGSADDGGIHYRSKTYSFWIDLQLAAAK
jgi:hypothetical protein